MVLSDPPVRVIPPERGPGAVPFVVVGMMLLSIFLARSSIPASAIPVALFAVIITMAWKFGDK